ncbi:MAG: flagellar protein [Clostridiales bacterium]|nr:flagellar protein [Eubacterium sp.]MDD5994470.1 flagellar protein [Clostridiales bacterium]MDD7349365.1 flagellar protein [Clostridiales bacterium]
MEVAACSRCGKLFNHISGPRVCPVCLKEFDDKFPEVKKYVYEHPQTGIAELSEAMDIPPKQIKRWIREERLSFSEESSIGIECEGCGKMIKTGRYCPDCKEKYTKEFGDAAGVNRPVSAAPVKRKSGESKMRFLN